MRSLSDEQLVGLVQEGSISAFEELVRRYQHRLLSYVERRVHDPHVAADVVQESFINLYKTIDRVDTRKKFSSYFYTMTRNQMISALRTHKPHVPLEDAEHIPADEALEEGLIRTENTAKLREAISQMDAKYKKAVTLYYFDDLSYEEMGRRLRLPVNTVRTHLKRAKAALKKLLEL